MLSSAPPTWRIDLSTPPRVLIIGTAVHGDHQLSEQYHSNVWVLLFFHYHGEIAVDEHRFTVQPGWAGVFPPDATLTIRYRGRSHHRYAHLALPAGRAGKDQPIAAVQDLGGDFAALDARFERAIRSHATVPERSRMILWDLLGDLAERTPRLLANARGECDVSAAPRHPVLAKAMEFIELGLAGPLRIDALAAEVGISARQLNNLFHAEHHVSPVAYVRQRRIERAWLLLTQTKAPIARIAADVGIPDLQAFNKTVRRALGASPRSVRQNG